MKVIKAQGTKKKTASQIDLELEGIPNREQTKIKKDVGEFLVEQILQYVAEQGSPIAGEPWPKLSPEYKKKKKAEGLSPVANLEASGELLDALTFKTTEDGLEIGFFNDQAWKADGHVKFSGLQNNTPQRRFLPAEGQSFKADIQKEVERIVLDAKSEGFDKSGLADITTKKGLYDYLMEQFGTTSRVEARLTVLRNADILKAIEDEELLDLL